MPHADAPKAHRDTIGGRPTSRPTASRPDPAGSVTVSVETVPGRTRAEPPMRVTYVGWLVARCASEWVILSRLGRPGLRARAGAGARSCQGPGGGRRCGYGAREQAAWRGGNPCPAGVNPRAGWPVVARRNGVAACDHSSSPGLAATRPPGRRARNSGPGLRTLRSDVPTS
jgi:hypothetical protein